MNNQQEQNKAVMSLCIADIIDIKFEIRECSKRLEFVNSKIEMLENSASSKADKEAFYVEQEALEKDIDEGSKVLKLLETKYKELYRKGV